MVHSAMPSAQFDPSSPATRTDDCIDDLPQRFRRLYFHLYSNSNASRAEVLLADLSLLLLTVLLAESGSSSLCLSAFLAGAGTANEALLPAMRRAYPSLVGDTDRFHLDDASLRHALGDLAGLRLAASASHVLGEAFQALIGPRIRGEKGQFFTPRSLVRCMVSICAPQPGERILDPACGTGGFLYEALTYVTRANGVPQALHGADKDRDLARFAAALLAYRAKSNSVVANINSLRSDEWREADFLEEYDVILTNPPFGTKIPIREATILREYKVAKEWIFDKKDNCWKSTDNELDSQDPQILFLELCIRKLRPGGRLAIVLPEGLFGNKQEAYLWDFVRSQGAIVGLLDCPRTTFQPGTDTKTNVLFFRKGAPAARGAAVPVAVALDCGHDRRGRTLRLDGTRWPDDFVDIGQGLSLSADRPAVHAPWKQVVPHNPYYLVPRYYAEALAGTSGEAALLAGAKWQSLGQLRSAGVIEVRKGHEIGSEAYGTGDVPFVRTSDLANFEISSDPTKSVSEEVYLQYSLQQKLRAGSILLVVDGRYRIGTTALVTDRTRRCVVQSHVQILDVTDSQQLDPYGLLLALNLPTVRRRIRDLVFIQSTLGTLGERLFELTIPILHGPGPWTATVNRFRESLMQRDTLLGSLREIVGPELDL